MKIKTKLTLSLAFLCAVIVLTVGVGSYYLNWLARDSRAIIQNNYQTLTYMQGINSALNTLETQLLESPIHPEIIEDASAKIQYNLALQKTNITETGEARLTEFLQQKINLLEQEVQTYLAQPSELTFVQQINPILITIREQTEQIYAVNEAALLQRNEIANTTAEQVVVYMAAMGIGSIILGLLFLFFLPVNIAKPIQQFNTAIQEIARRNYSYQVDVDRSDEFGELAQSFNSMAAKLDEYEHSNLALTLREKQRIEALIHHMPEAVIGIDEQQRVIFCNELALNLHGLNRADFVGKKVTDLSSKNALFEHLISDLLTGSYRDKPQKTIKIVHENKERLFLRDIIPIQSRLTGDNEPTSLGHVLVLQDITEFSEKDRAKTSFMATLSHELKTPLAGIAMSLQLLHNEKIGSLNEEQLELLHNIRDSHRRINRIITDILEITRIESGNIQINSRTSNPMLIVERAIDGVTLFLKEKNMSVEKKHSVQLPDVVADPHKLVWVLNNFLTNAIRYSPQGSRLQLSIVAQNGNLRFAVRDEGPGIKAEDQQRIFQKFQRLQSSDGEGTGLGLAISKEFVEAMGGQIGVNSQPGIGAEFWFTLPVEK